MLLLLRIPQRTLDCVACAKNTRQGVEVATPEPPLSPQTDELIISNSFIILKLYFMQL